MASIFNNYSYFTGGDYHPLSNGYVYFGMPDMDARIPANQVQVRVLQENGQLIKIPHPIRTNQNGLAVFLGTPIQINIDESIFSTYVEDINNNLLYTRPRAQYNTPPIAGESGNYLETNGTDVLWSDPLPDQSGQDNNVLTTDGTIPSWGELLPPQTGNAGKTLSTDGTNPSWQSNLPNQSGNENKYLFTNGTDATWENPFFEPIIVNDQDLIHSFDVVLPKSGKILVISSTQLYISGVASGFGMSLTVNGNAASWFSFSLGSIALRRNMSVFSLNILEGNAGETVSVNSTVSGIGPPESPQNMYSLFNHLTTVIGAY